MKISVITPAFNCARYIRECIESVRNQGDVECEHIVIDGGSTDGTVEILQQYKHVQWISEKDRGEADALNKALVRATGDIIYWLNADDVAAEMIFPLIIQEMQAGADVVYGKALIIDERGTPIGLRIPKAPLSVAVLLRWFQHLHISQPSMFISKKVFDAVGLFRDDLFFSIDLELWLRIAEAGYSFVAVDHVLSKARLIRSDAKSAAPRETQERNWLEVSAPFLAQLPRLERVNFWKDYYMFYLRERANGEVSPTTNPDELVGLSQAFFEMGLSAPLHTLAAQIVKAFPKLGDAHTLYAEILSQQGRTAEASISASQGLRCEQELRPSQPLIGLRAHQRATVLFPHMPYPSRSGAHVRALAYSHALRELGYDLTWVGIEQFSDTVWDDHSVERFKRDHGIKVRVLRKSESDERWTAERGLFESGGIVKWAGFTPPNLKHQFRELCSSSKPDLIVVNYAFWGNIVDDSAFHSAKKLLETHDIVMLNRLRREQVEQTLGELHRGDQQALIRLIDERFYDALEVPDLSSEFAQSGPFNQVITITPEETAMYERGAPQVPITYIPGGFEVPRRARPRHDGLPVFVIGPNPFNIQAYLYLAARVLPNLLTEAPDTRVRVIGAQSAILPEVQGLDRIGSVDDLAVEYAQAPCALCPLIGGTGMQMKIVEAMAFGVPVVALRNMAGSSPITHGVNGFIAQNAEEFAAYTATLLRDRARAKTMGRAAQEAIQERFSLEAFTLKLGDAIAVAGRFSQ